METLNMLKALPLFAGFAPEELDFLASRIQTGNFGEGAVLLREGATSEETHILLRGVVEIRKRFGGQDVVVAELVAGNLLGEGGLLSPTPQTTMAMAIAKTKVESLIIHRQTLEDAAKERPWVAIKLLRTIGTVLSIKLRRLDEAYVKLFMESRGAGNIGELRELQDLLTKEWALPAES